MNTGLGDVLAFTLITKASGHILCKLYDMFLQSEDRLYISVTCQSIFIRIRSDRHQLPVQELPIAKLENFVQ